MCRIKVFAIAMAISVCCVNKAWGQFVNSAPGHVRTTIQNKIEPLPFEERSTWHVGVELGPRFNFARFTNLDESIFSQPSMQSSFVFGLFLKKDFAEKFSLRPEILFLKRNARVDFRSSVCPEGYSAYYNLKASYFDIRLPLMYEVNRRWVFCPYVYLAPVFGVVRGGDVNMSVSTPDGKQKESIALNKSNVNPIYFAAMAAVGVNFNIKNLANIGVELGYEYGITDTYSKNEKEGRAIVKDNFCYPAYNVSGNRMLSGLELKISVSVPFSTFKKRKPAPSSAPAYTPAPAPAYVAPVVEVPEAQPETPYYLTIEEANAAIKEGRDISGAIISDPRTITFENNSSNIKKTSYAYLNAIVEFMNNTLYNIEIQGHTDNVGDEVFNMDLSEKRAKSVCEYIVSHGIDSNRIDYTFYGESRPLADNDTAEGRALNRRVEFKIKKQ